jgi:hypothetical protein
MLAALRQTCAIAGNSSTVLDVTDGWVEEQQRPASPQEPSPAPDVNEVQEEAHTDTTGPGAMDVLS